MKEKELKKQISSWLSWQGYETHLIEPARGLRWVRGIPDIVAMKDGITLWVETKAKGNQQTPQQREFEEKCKRAGVVYILAYTLEDAIQCIHKTRNGTEQDTGGRKTTTSVRKRAILS